MSYDFASLTKEELIEELKIVDDMRIWRIAEAIRKDISYEEIHAITKIDIWFIDKLANSCRNGTGVKRTGINRRLTA